MGKTLLFFMLLSAKLTFGQVVDDFSDGDFLVKPGWIGQTDRYKINKLNQLQTSLSVGNQAVVLVTPNKLATNVNWEFFIQLNFDPSANNQAKIYLMSDQSDLNASLNGYFIQIGENGNADSYDLYRQTGTIITKIIDGASKPRADVNKLSAKIKVARDDLGNWTLYTDILDGNGPTLEGKATDVTHIYTDWFGVNCKYTATRSEGFIFDDFKVEAQLLDVKKPSLISAKTLNEFTVEAVFSERLSESSALQIANYQINNFGSPKNVTFGKTPNTCLLSYNDPLPTGDYKLIVNNIADLSNNLILPNSALSFFHLQPYELKKGDLLISEILVNPTTGGVDFIEIYNPTNQILDLQSVQLANAAADGSAANKKIISANAVYMPPKTYWVLTTNVNDVKQRYEVNHPQQFVEMSSLPSYNNDKGTVILLTANLILERFNYNDKMHVPLLQNADGVSLERVSFLKNANERGNFTSTAMSSGFATPTGRNSQMEDNAEAKNRVKVANKTFSPDGDGFEDLLTINYQFAKSGQFATVNIYTDRGLLVRRLQRNTSIATAGSFEWDGLDDGGRLSRIGIYVVAFETFSLAGKTEKFTEACVLAAKLN